MEERRQNYPDVLQELKEIKVNQGRMEVNQGRMEERLIAVDKRINGSLDTVAKHIDQGTKWRMAIVVAFIGLVGVFVNNIRGFGNAEKQIEINTARLNRLEQPLFKR